MDTSSNTVSPKIVASSIGGAVATIIWIVVAAVTPGLFSDTQVTALTGATATVLAFAFGYLVTDPSAGHLLTPRRSDGTRSVDRHRHRSASKG